MKDLANIHQLPTACKQYCLAAGATQGNIAYTQTVNLLLNSYMYIPEKLYRPIPSGFLLEISNTNNSEVTIAFFRNDPIPSGVTIRSRNTDYSYAALLSIAQTEGFTGSGIVTDDERVSLLTIYRNHQPTQYQFLKILDGLEIFIDGKDNYLSLNFPPMSTTLVQLMPRFDDR